VPNGKIHDHWYTDVTVHLRETFTPAIDELIKRLEALKREQIVALIELRGAVLVIPPGYGDPDHFHIINAGVRCTRSRGHA